MVSPWTIRAVPSTGPPHPRVTVWATEPRSLGASERSEVSERIMKRCRLWRMLETTRLEINFQKISFRKDISSPEHSTSMTMLTES
jgi:hypothetical protein